MVNRQFCINATIDSRASYNMIDDRIFRKLYDRPSCQPIVQAFTANNLLIKLEATSFITFEGPDFCENVVVYVQKNCVAPIVSMNVLDKFKTILINNESYVI